MDVVNNGWIVNSMVVWIVFKTLMMEEVIVYDMMTIPVHTSTIYIYIYSSKIGFVIQDFVGIQ